VSSHNIFDARTTAVMWAWNIDCAWMMTASTAGWHSQGIKELVIEPWFGVFVPAGTPAPIVARRVFGRSTTNFDRTWPVEWRS